PGRASVIERGASAVPGGGSASGSRPTAKGGDASGIASGRSGKQRRGAGGGRGGSGKRAASPLLGETVPAQTAAGRHPAQAQLRFHGQHSARGAATALHRNWYFQTVSCPSIIPRRGWKRSPPTRLSAFRAGLRGRGSA